MKALILTLQFLTRLPLPFTIEGPDDLFARGMKYFPLAGLILGLLEAAAAFGLHFIFPAAVTAMMVVFLDVFLTGGLHMDGLADTVDALGSHRSRERMLEIMKDSRIGTFGVLGVIMTLSVRIAMYAVLLDHMEDCWMRWGILLVIPVIGRTVMAFLIYISDYARKEGMGGLFFAHKASMNLPVTLILGLLFSAAAGYYGPALLILGLLVGLWVRHDCYRKIGGMTGDTLGAALVITEGALAFAAAFLFCIFI